jgi:hypothetical protein
LIDPRLQTAVSSSLVTSRISVQRLDRCTTAPLIAVWLHRSSYVKQIAEEIIHMTSLCPLAKS